MKMELYVSCNKFLDIFGGKTASKTEIVGQSIGKTSGDP